MWGPRPSYASTMHGKRRDIQGLRAVAVLLVIANHLFGWPLGGFIGVDVFFVISGFLITGLLLREHARTGRISFGNFYRRRIKRILPASLTVIVVTVIVGFVVFAQTRFESLFVDGLWATLFSANWRFITLGTDYMHVNDAVSPLQHYWSLSIEEQFYFVWPIILLAVLTVVAKRKLRAAAIAISAIGVLSFAWAMLETADQPTWAYFSTFSRAWELAAGALLAIASTRLSAMPSRARPILAWGGLATIAVGVVFIVPETAFPGPFALVPVLGACLVIAAGIGRSQQGMWLLSNRGMGYVGDISYSLYLWHFPVIVFAGIFLAETPRRLAVVALGVTILLSVLSYHFIENPARLQSGRSRIVVPAVGISGVLALSLAAVSIAPQPSAAEQPSSAQSSVLREGDSAARSVLWADIDDALDQTDWPELNPTYDGTKSSDKAPEWVKDGCLGNEAGSDPDPIKNAERCRYGETGSDKVAVVLGDSVAISWVPGIRSALEPLGYQIEVVTAQQCPAASLPAQYNDGSDMEGCDELRAWALDRIAHTQPDLVIASSVPSTLSRLSSGSVGAAAQQEWELGMAKTLTRLTESADRVVLLQSPPSRNGGEACALKNSVPSDCLLQQTESYALMDEADSNAASSTGAVYAATSSWFCSIDGQCPAFTGTMPVTVDGPHLTAAYSEKLAPVLREVLTGTVAD
jgi:peptidoglycan/LPS O-acetylase OafA/YrhL